MRPGLEQDQTRTTSEAVAELTELDAGLAADGVWTLVAALEHVARRWMTEFMQPGEQSVGAAVSLEQVLPRPPATRIVSTATVRDVRGRRFSFVVVLRNEAGELLGSGVNERVLIATGR